MPLRPPAGYIRPGYDPLEVADAPTVGTASAGDTTASVAFTAPSNVGGGAISLYYAVSSPGQFTGTSVTSPVTVTGLTNGTSYTFTVWAANPFGPSPYSASSNSVTPSFTYIEDVFSTYLYTGTGSGTQTITNGIDLAGNGGLVWIKSRTATTATTGHALFDTARGREYGLATQLTGAQQGPSPVGSDFASFNSNGFTVSANNFYWTLNPSGVSGSMVSWTFRKAPKFFDVVTYTGDGSSNRNISHSLGSTPGCIIVKRTNAGGNDWWVWHRSISTGNLSGNNLIRLNLTDAATIATTDILGTASSTTFQVGFDADVNGSGNTYVAYLFAHDAGGFGLTGTDNVISCGSYTGNGSTSGPTITLGYEPQWVLIKESSAAGNQWVLFDNMRGMPVGSNDNYLFPNLSNAESSAYDLITPTATGFSLAQSLGIVNASGSTYIYIAIRRGPMKTPTTGTSVFNSALDVASSPTFVSNFPVDSEWFASKTGTDKWYQTTRLQGGVYLNSASTAAEATSSIVKFDYQNGAIVNFVGGSNYIGYSFRRAPGFFDVVCYTGTGSSSTSFSHNLGVAPELIISKTRSGSTSNWIVTSNFTSTNYLLTALNLTIAGDTYLYTDGASISAQPTSTTLKFTGGVPAVNDSGATYVAYLFASCPGVSKVGSYTGTGALQTINCGFTGGARWVMIKRTDSTGDWFVYDSARGITSGNDPYLLMNSTAAEVTGTNYVDTTSVGFQVTAAAPAGLNANGGTYIFLAIA